MSDKPQNNDIIEPTETAGEDLAEAAVQAGEEPVEAAEPNQPTRLQIKIGDTVFMADDSMVAMTTDKLKDALKFQYPEVEHATVREATDAETGVRSVHWLPRPGRKG